MNNSLSVNLQLAKKNAAVCKMSYGKKSFFLLSGQETMGSRISCGESVDQWSEEETEFF